MDTVNYQQRKTFEKYDNTNYLLYLNEQSATFTQSAGMQEEPKEVEGYSYTGTMPDGSIEIYAPGVTNENRRSLFIAGLVSVKYPIDAQIAILANGTTTAKRANELSDFEAYRLECKQQIDDLLNRI